MEISFYLNIKNIILERGKSDLQRIAVNYIESKNFGHVDGGFFGWFFFFIFFLLFTCFFIGRLMKK